MKSIARLTSVLFHPLLFPLYGASLILFTNPNRFGPFGDKLHTVWLIIIFALTFMFPVVWLAMMRGLKMIDNLRLETQKERIIPFVATITFYLWAAWMFKPTAHMKIPTDPLFFYLLLGACFAAFVSFFLNVFMKISLHAVAAGGLLGLLLTLSRYSTYDLRVLLLAVILLAGAIGTARLVLNAHSDKEVAMGYLVGFTAQFMAFTIVPRFF